MMLACNKVVEASATKAHYRYYLSKHIENLCCGKAFENYDDVHERAVNLHDALIKHLKDGTKYQS